MAPKRRKAASSSSHESQEPEQEPFKITIETNPNKRKHNGPLVHAETNPWNKDMKYHYAVTSANGNDNAWEDVKRYTKFQVRRHWDPENPLTLESGDLIYVESNPDEIAPDGSAESPDDARFWIAKVLECRAINSARVFLRCLWIYRPEDLPGGRQPYHGEHEVIPSNHMQIIDALTVDGKVEDLQYFNEKDDEGSKSTRFEDKYWRQTFNERTNKTSKLREYCTCKQPANPDVALIQCANTDCKKWMHQSCISRDTIIRTYTENAEQMREQEEKSGEVEAEEASDTITVAPAETIVDKIKSVFGGSKGKGQQSESRAASAEGDDSGNGHLSANEPTTPEDSHASKPAASQKRGRGRPRTKKLSTASREDTAEYAKASEQFSAQIIIETDAGTTGGEAPRKKLVEDGAVSVEITDLRKEQGKNTWREPIKCLWCSNEVS